METNFEDQNDQSTPIKTGTNIKRADEFISVQEEIKELKDSISKEKETVHIIKGAVKSIEEKLDETVSSLSNTTARISYTSNESSAHGMEQSRNIVKLGIQRHVLQIQQLIGMKLQSENPDLKLIEKCNNVDVPKVSKAVTSCG